MSFPRCRSTGGSYLEMEGCCAAEATDEVDSDLKFNMCRELLISGVGVSNAASMASIS